MTHTTFIRLATLALVRSGGGVAATGFAFLFGFL
jgi:hypothetical protein